jgi:hypothetical protein
MVLRGADYPRKANEDYRTPAKPVLALISLLTDVSTAWVPSDRGGDSILAATLRAHGIETVSTDADFLTMREPPPGCDLICDNPPFAKGGRLAVAFIEHAILLVPFTALLLPVDFDSARSRTHLFRDCPSVTGRLILLRGIVCFANGPASESANHMWGIPAIMAAARPSSTTKPNPICRRASAGPPLLLANRAYPTAALRRLFR